MKNIKHPHWMHFRFQQQCGRHPNTNLTKFERASLNVRPMRKFSKNKFIRAKLQNKQKTDGPESTQILYVTRELSAF